MSFSQIARFLKLPKTGVGLCRINITRFVETVIPRSYMKKLIVLDFSLGNSNICHLNCLGNSVILTLL